MTHGSSSHLQGVRAYTDQAAAWQRLAQYLEEEFQPQLLDFDELRRYLDREWRELHPDFYTRSQGYLYDLTHFHYMGAKDTFFHTLLTFADRHRLTRIADVGCGIALDAQALLNAGYDVHAYDLNNPSLAYARWRFEHEQGTGERIHTLDTFPRHDYDLVYAVDVIGHSSNPDTTIVELFRAGRYVCVNLPPHDDRHRYGPADLHPQLDHERILPVLQRHGTLLRLTGGTGSTISLWRSHLFR
ncbi:MULTISPECIES: bifunctional 2-polyprenyl-6-hydroxyphenol methylase/3-demethylubiquinol 3-O-methyltransferase UbiG [unclassified Nocardiopsis]|uniref:class I SAM-dependent methyltransferase n=1 Tax=unclassified Nocardiopsis TaxID=2649073 RepID=UPI0013581D09|nr:MULTISPECIES: methyltransferase domain-containing protein [unclassified Nocardiopsis]